MAVLAQALFGSRARGDHSETSDVDLLLATDDEQRRHTQIAGVSVSSYPMVDLRQMAVSGDLFVYHVLFEGKPLYDPNSWFDALRKSFRLKANYSKEIRRAVDVGWLLVNRRDAVADQNLVGRRAAWVVRSVLISRSAEAGRPIFSRQGLADMIPGSGVTALIAAKDDATLDGFAPSALRRFLEKLGYLPALPERATPDQYATLFKRTDNAVGLRLLSSAREPGASIYT